MSSDHELPELSDAARQAGYIVSEQIDSLLERAAREADTIRRDAHRDAEDIRRQAVDSAERLLGRLRALEFPLGQLVVSLRDEVEQVSQGLSAGVAVEADGRELPAVSGDTVAFGASATEDAPAPTGDRDFEDQPPASEIPAAMRAPAPAGPARFAASEATPKARLAPLDLDPAPRPQEHKKGSRLGQRKSRPPGDSFIGAEGSCAICQRRLKVGTEGELADTGWKVSGDVGLCPECQADRWQLPEGARLPFRRGVV